MSMVYRLAEKDIIGCTQPKFIITTVNSELFLQHCINFLVARGFKYCRENMWVYLIAGNCEEHMTLFDYLEIKL